jgi:hypothetical protein
VKSVTVATMVLGMVGTLARANALHEIVNYVSQSVPAWATFDVQGNRLLDFRRSDATGTFSIAIPALPHGAIVDGGSVTVYGGMNITNYFNDSPIGEYVTGGFTWNSVLQYNGVPGEIGNYTPGPTLLYSGAGPLIGDWDITYGAPDLGAFGTKNAVIHQRADIGFWVQADVTVDYRLVVAPEPRTLGSGFAGLLLIAGGLVRQFK